MSPDRSATSDDSAAARPLLRVVRGHPDPVELAALVAVLARRSAAAAAVAAVAAATPALGASAGGGRARSAWSDPGRALTPDLRPAPDSWRRSALPR